MRCLGRPAVLFLWIPVLVIAQSAGEELLARANAAYRALRPAEAVKLYREYLSRYSDRADVHVFLGAALLNLELLPEALEEANRAIALDAHYAKAAILAGRICSARGQWEAGQEFFRKAQHLDPHDTDGWYFSGRAFFEAGRFENAIAAYEQALRTGAGQSRIYENLGLAEDALGKTDAAEKSLRKSVELAGGASRPYVAYGAFLFRQNRLSNSLVLLRKAVELEPASTDARFELARVLYHDGAFAGAAAVLEPALPSGECRIHNLLARIYFAAGNRALGDAQIRAVGNCRNAGRN